MLLKFSTLVCALALVKSMPRPNLQTVTLEAQRSDPDMRRFMDGMFSRVFMSMPGMLGMSPMVMPYGIYPYQGMYDAMNRFPSVSPYGVPPLPDGSAGSHMLPGLAASSASDMTFRSRYQPTPKTPNPDQETPTKSPKKRPSKKFMTKLKRRYNNKKSFYQRIKAKHTTSSSVNFKTRIPSRLFDKFPFNMLPGLYIDLPHARKGASTAASTTTDDTINTSTTTSPDTTTIPPTSPTRPIELPRDIASSLPYESGTQQGDIIFGSKDTSKNAAENAGPVYGIAYA